MGKEPKLTSRDLPAHSVPDEETKQLQSFLLLLLQSLKQHLPLLLDTMKNFCDILIPLDQLAIYKSNVGIIGFGGLMFSVAGMITVAYAHMKLKIHQGGCSLRSRACFKGDASVEQTLVLVTNHVIL